MITESIQRIWALTPLYTSQTQIKTQVDEVTGKRTLEFVEYKIYNRQGQIEESHKTQLDLRA